MGGKAFEGKTSRIDISDIYGTIANLSEKLSVDYPQLSYAYMSSNLLGSAGKSPTSGDLDINMDETQFDIHELTKVLINILGEDNVKSRPQFNQIFTCVPVGHAFIPPTGQQYVQVDFMFGDHAWQKFSYFSLGVLPPGTSSYRQSYSRYKGLYRTELIKAMVAYNSDWVYEENGEMVARVGPTFFHDRGLVWRCRHRPFKKGSTTERIKALKEVPMDEFKKLYPSAVIQFDDQYTMKDPEQMSEFLFGVKAIQASVFDSYELLEQNLRWRYRAHERKILGKIYLERLNSLGVEIPTVILRDHS